MTDARLVATNPADSTLVPVSCNSRGELATQSPVIEQIDNDVTIMGQVGIGTVDPQAILHVFLPSSTDEGVYFKGGNNRGLEINDVTLSGSNNNGDLTRFYKESSTGSYSFNNTSGELVRIDGITGNVGIGTVDPQAKLEVNGHVIVGSRSKSWILVEQGGLCHMVEQESKIGDEVRYPHLRDVLSEIDSIKNALEVVMDKLRINPPEGWPVWDGSDTSREN